MHGREASEQQETHQRCQPLLEDCIATVEFDSELLLVASVH